MANIDPMENREPRRADEPLKVVAGGSIVQAICAAAAVVLAILGLGGLMPPTMIAIASILIGAAFLSQGGTLAARYSRLMHEVASERAAHAELGGGVSAEFIGGATGVVLGVLALIGVAPLVLGPISVIVLGGTLLVGSGIHASLSGLGTAGREHDVGREALMAATGTNVLVGLGAAVLGILALVGIDAVTLPLVAFLVLGASVLLSGAVVGGRLIGLARR